MNSLSHDQSPLPERSTHDVLADLVASLGPAGLRSRRAQADRLVEDDGVLAGSMRRRRQRWSLDPLPVLVSAQEWKTLEPGLIQRAELLAAVLADLYGDGVLLRERVIPPELVLSNPSFVRAATRPPVALRLVTSATDVVRTSAGWQVLADSVQVPTGAGYALQARRVVARVFPTLYRNAGMHRLRPYLDALRATLADLAPSGQEAARVVVLAPEAANQTAFDHAFLATLLGYPLATSKDITVRDGAVFLRSLGRLERVDVIFRRIPDAESDGLELATASTAGVPGLLGAWRRGTVAVANPIGSGVLESVGLQPFLGAACRLLLGQDLILPTPFTWWCGAEAERSHVLKHLEELVLVPLPGPRGQAGRPFVARKLSVAKRRELEARIQVEPYLWCAQQPVDADLVSVIGESGVEPKPFTLRALTVAGPTGFDAMNGGLGRVLGEANRARPNSPDTPAKDVWVLTSADLSGRSDDGDRPPRERITVGTSHDRSAINQQDEPWPSRDQIRTAGAPLAPRVAEHLFTLGSQLERAESLVRLVRVVDELNEEWGVRPDGSGVPALRAMRSVLVTATGADVDALWPLVTDPEQERGVATAIAASVDAATAIREQLSGDVWIVLGGLERTVLAAAQERTAMQPLLAHLLEGLLAMSGLAAESLVRDTGWYLADAGRRLERAEVMLDLLLGGMGLPETAEPIGELNVPAAVLEAILVAAESSITYRRRHPGGAHAGTVLDLLVRDRDNPRSVAFQLDRLVLDLEQLPSQHDYAPRVITVTLAESTAHVATTSDLRRLRAGVREVRDVVRRRHFPHTVTPQPLSASGYWSR